MMEIILIFIGFLIGFQYAKVKENPKSKASFVNGHKGELEVLKILKKIPGHKRIFHDVLLPLPDSDRLTQIDIILICEKGIYCIEVKNYKGLILGGEYWKEWYQIFPNKKNPFQNPLHQNFAHTSALKSILGRDEAIKSLILFGPKAKLQLKDSLTNGQVMKWTEMKSLHFTAPYACLSRSYIDELALDISKHFRSKRKDRRKHLKDLRRK